MKHIKTFKIFESVKSEGSKNFPRLTDDGIGFLKLLVLPEMKTMKEVLSHYGSETAITTDDDGSIVIYSLSLPTFKIEKDGSLKCGDSSVIPVTSFPIKTWPDLLDFISIYSIKRILYGRGIIVGDELEKFAFEGKPPKKVTLEKMFGERRFWLLKQIAERRGFKMRGIHDNCVRALEKIFAGTRSDIDKNKSKIILILKELVGFKGLDDLAGTIENSVRKNPQLLGIIEEGNQELYEILLKRIGWDRIGPDLLRQIKSGII
jgi:hypothetical protein